MNRTLSIGLFSVIFIALFSTQLISFSGGPPGGRTGSPGDNNLTCNSSGCHNSFGLNTGTGLASITSDVPATGYVPGQTYNFTFKIVESGIGRFGFEGTVYNEASMGFVGDLIATDEARTRVFSDFGKEYVSHNFQGIDGSADSTEWSVAWAAPAVGTGDVGVYAAFNATNNNSSPSGDNIYTSVLSLSEAASTNVEESLIARSFKWFQRDQQLSFSLELEKSGELDWELLNLEGKKLFAGSAYVPGRDYSATVNVNQLPQGVYVLAIQSRGQKLQQKIVLR